MRGFVERRRALELEVTVNSVPLMISSIRAIQLSVLFVSILFFPPAIVFAEESEVSVEEGEARDAVRRELPADLPPIPSSADSEAKLILNAKNASLFHELLLAPIASWLKDSKFSSRVVRDLNFPWLGSPASVLGSRSNASILRVGSDGGILKAGVGEVRKGFPFGLQTELDRETDPILKARKILWNSTFATLPTGKSLYAFDMIWFGSEGVRRRGSASFFSEQRELSALLRSADETKESSNLLQRELLQFSSPPAVFGAATLTWRYFGNQPDDVWIYSPLLAKSRKVFGANRSDSIIGSTLNLEDLFVFSSKTENLTARVVDDRQLLVSFPQLGMGDLLMDTVDGVNAKGVLTARGSFRGREGQSSFLQFNGENRQYGDLPAWVPTTSVLIPRRVWIVELSSNDPFSQSGRSIVVIDKESLLPVYKIVYDRSGNYLRTIIGGWALVSSDTERTPVLAYLIAVDRKAAVVTALVTSSFRIFTEPAHETAQRFLQLLNIEEHEKQAVTAPASISPEQQPPTAIPAGAEEPTAEVDTESAVE